MEGIEVAQAAGAQVVADQQAACDAFFADIDQLCTHAAEYLAEMSHRNMYPRFRQYQVGAAAATDAVKFGQNQTTENPNCSREFEKVGQQPSDI